MEKRQAPEWSVTLSLKFESTPKETFSFFKRQTPAKISEDEKTRTLARILMYADDGKSESRYYRMAEHLIKNYT